MKTEFYYFLYFLFAKISAYSIYIRDISRIRWIYNRKNLPKGKKTEILITLYKHTEDNNKSLTKQHNELLKLLEA